MVFPETMLSIEQLQTAYHSACRTELAALKPGNVGEHAGGHNMSVQDFHRSADVSAAPLCDMSLSLGERIYRAVECTRAAVGCNTNLGIILLVAPLLEVFSRRGDCVHNDLEQLLADTTVSDAAWAYRAIRLAAPAGLGVSAEHDVQDAPEVTLRETMAAAADRDMIARQYVTGFAEVLDSALPMLREYQECDKAGTWAVTRLYVSLLARFEDSHVVRKHGVAEAESLRLRFAGLEERLAQTSDTPLLRLELLDLDRVLKRAGINPGTSADLTVATLLVDRLQKIRNRPPADVGLCYKRSAKSRGAHVRTA